MTGNTRTYALDDRNSKYLWPKSTVDSSVRELSKVLYGIHDDLIDHPISVTSEGWAALRRVVAFLSSDLQIDAATDNPTWPFSDESQWRKYESLANECELPEYDPVMHGRPVGHWTRRIPTTVGVAIMLGLIVLMIALAAWLS